MVASYLLSSTFVPILSVWVLRMASTDGQSRATFFDRLRGNYDRLARFIMKRRRIVVFSYLVISGAIILLVGGELGTEIFPLVDTGQFQLHLRAPAGTRIERTDRAGVLGVTAEDVAKSVVAGTSSSRYTSANYGRRDDSDGARP
jgi:multidrug efflux pump subunit AcrB